jgi:hypothetical protein
MKKSHLLLGLGISISLLTACQKQESTTPSTSEATTTTIEETTVAPKPVTDYTLYNSVLQDYKEALKKQGGSFNKENINNYILIAKTNPDLQGASYILYDFDKNGVEELLVATTSRDNKHAILDIRTIIDGKVVQVTNAENQLSFIGERMNIFPLEDGTFTYIGAASAKDHVYAHYKWNEIGSELERVKEGTTPDVIEGLAPKLNIPENDWYPVQWYITSPEKQKEMAKAKLNLQAIQNGDYTTLKGTWANRLGYSLKFNENGLVSDNETVDFSRLKDENGILRVGIQPKIPGPGGAVLAFIPAGVTFPYSTSDPSQIDYDRLWVGQSIANDPASFYYKIDE